MKNENNILPLSDILDIVSDFVPLNTSRQDIKNLIEANEEYLSTLILEYLSHRESLENAIVEILDKYERRIRK